MSILRLSLRRTTVLTIGACLVIFGLVSSAAAQSQSNSAERRAQAIRDSNLYSDLGAQFLDDEAWCWLMHDVSTLLGLGELADAYHVAAVACSGYGYYFTKLAFDVTEAEVRRTLEELRGR